MPAQVAPLNVSFVLELTGFDQLLQSLRQRGYRIIGPRLRDGAIVYDELTAASDLPIGWTDEQEGGTYRLKKRNDQTLFGFAVGPHSWKQFLHPPAVRLWQVTRDAKGFKFQPETLPHPKLALVGVRSCELHAMAVQDKVFLNGDYMDSAYQARRENTFVMAVNCGQAGGTCFCVSMKTGPQATGGYDLVLTEVCEAGRHYFLIEAGSEMGAQVLGEVPRRPARPEENQAARRVMENTARQMGRSMDTVDLKDLLYRNYDNPRWDDVASRCLTCANCTMVCPTCFCTTVEDVTDLTGERAERWQKWDSCFTTDFSYIHGGSVRTSAKARYRQWMTHKLATWIDQFGTSGCVGCGRCITWCPVAIDITEEVRAIRQSEAANAKPGKRK
jgi:formate hydrogenlyase subunit 6/NADH:ubiquinone oxidoreductase subunit I